MKNQLLIELVQSGELLKTGAKPKLPIKIPNLSDENLDVYRIPVNYLYYNNENGRIASAISRLDFDLFPANDIENPEYNQIIERMIIEDNSQKLKQTKKSIKESGQKVFGYVLADGRIVDGNRRFTALRQLSAETGNTHMFEAVILPITYESKSSRAVIKRLELAIQMGTEERQSYDPVDLSVDIYQTVVVDTLMTANDYASESSLKPKDVEDQIKTVQLMKDFLVFVNAKENAYHIIKDAKLYNPLYELTKKLYRQYPNKGPKYEQSKITAFALLAKMMVTGGDTVREIRDYFNDVLTTNTNDDFNYAIEETVDQLRDRFDESEVKSITDFQIVLEKSTPELRAISEEYSQVRNRYNRGKNVDSFITNIKDSLKALEDIRRGNGMIGVLSFSNFSKDQIKDLRDSYIKMSLICKELIEIYDDEL